MKRKLLGVVAISISLICTSLPTTQAEVTLRVREIPSQTMDAISTYFLMIDRFENGDPNNDGGVFGDSRLRAGLDPSDISFFHGGDFIGIEKRLDYIRSMGFNAIWITPPVKNVSGGFGAAAYHGYAGVDFTTVDSRFGTMFDFKSLVEAAHQKGMKVFVDVVVNHTADIIQPQDGDSSYQEKKYSPYRDFKGKPFKITSKISSGKAPFPKLSVSKSFPKVPVASPAEENLKRPSFLRDLTNYHNRGDSTFQGESVELGDFYGLDDLFTEKPEVVKGWIATWSRWIREFEIDGMRIDTYKHVNDEFWHQFIPAIQKVARSVGKESFPIFGEVYDADPASLAYYIREVSAPSLLDFGFQNRVERFVANGVGALELAQLFNDDDFYTTDRFSARGLATFLGNHDMGRIGLFIKKRNPLATSQELMERVELAMAMLFLLRGSPVGYYGDEKGLIGDPGDKGARQDLFATKVTRWQNEERIGAQPIGSQSSFESAHPLESTIAQLQKFAQSASGFRIANQRTRFAQQGTFLVSRTSGDQEFWIAFNASDDEVFLQVEPSLLSDSQVLLGRGSLIAGTFTLPPRSFLVASSQSNGRTSADGLLELKELDSGFGPIGAREFGVEFISERNTLISFYLRKRVKDGWGDWEFLGSTDRPTFKTTNTPGDLYRIFLSKKAWRGKAQVIGVAEGQDGKVIRTNLLTLNASR